MALHEWPNPDPSRRRVLVAGWFSLQGHGATAGDLMARDLACKWLSDAGRSYDVANDPPFTGGVDWRVIDPGMYSELLLVCGPFIPEELADLRARFGASHLTGLNLSILDSADRRQFEFLLERESGDDVNADIVFAADVRPVPVVGVIATRELQREGIGLVDEANQAIKRLLDRRDIAVTVIDTRLDSDRGLTRTPAQVASLVARMDLVVTTRLHGFVLAMRAGVPAVVIDPIVGGGKILPQTRLVGWPYAFGVDGLHDHELEAAFDACLTEESRQLAARCGDRGRNLVQGVGNRFAGHFAEPGAPAAADIAIAQASPAVQSSAHLDLFPNSLAEVVSWASALQDGLEFWKAQADAWENATRMSQEEVADVRRGLEWWKRKAESSPG